MVPREPPRRPQLGFLYVPPLRIQGLSTAGEESVIQIPELDTCFDIGRAPKASLTSKYVALSHGHMDHAAGLAYYFSQRYFQGLGTGTVICHPDLAQPIHNIMAAWVDLEAQRTPYQVHPLAPEQEIEIKNRMFLRAFQTVHTVPSLGYVVIERRSKLKPEFQGLEQEELLQLKDRGEQITQTVEIPLLCYTGDTYWGSHFDRPDVLESKILITECTFLESRHRSRASVGKHLHLTDIVRLLERSKAEAVVLVHLSRRTNMQGARNLIDAAIPERHRDRVLLLMDSRENRARLDRQKAESDQSDQAEQPEA